MANIRKQRGTEFQNQIGPDNVDFALAITDPRNATQQSKACPREEGKEIRVGLLLSSGAHAQHAEGSKLRLAHLSEIRPEEPLDSCYQS